MIERESPAMPLGAKKRARSLGRTMVHFTAEQWFEFASDTEPTGQNLLMQQHLEQGCDSCRKLLAMWREVLEIGAREARYQPPAGMLRSVEAMYVPKVRWRWFPQVAEAAHIIFDSLLDPVPAGVRGAALSRQFLQESAPFVVDLRAAFEPARQWIHLVGQVLNSAEPQSNVSDVEVFLLSGEELAAKTKANASGEFELEFKDSENLQLFVDIRGRKVIEVRVPTYLDMTKTDE
jgi:hypothetical protein